MHPSNQIRGRRSQLLRGRRIVLGVSGSIAAVEVPRIVRELIRHGAEVEAVMSSEATRIITADAIRFATGHPPVLQLTGDVEHVSLIGSGETRADLLLLAPATADTISKIAQGIDDTPVTSSASVALGAGVPIMIAPAMHASMGKNPAVRENLERLRSWGVEVVASQSAEGEEKLASPEEIAARVLHRLATGPWANRRVIVIAGASRQSLDDVRSITNESSGATGVALAVQAFYRGAEVELWAGALQVPVPGFLHVTAWRSVEELLALVRAQRSSLRRAAAVLVPAAVADFSVKPIPGKISSRDRSEWTIHLHRVPKVLPELRRRAPPPTLVVGFKLEAREALDHLESEGRRLLAESGADVVVANSRSSMGGGTWSGLVLTASGTKHPLQGEKFEVAGKLLDDLGRDIRAFGKPSRSKTRRARSRHSSSKRGSSSPTS